MVDRVQRVTGALQTTGPQPVSSNTTTLGEGTEDIGNVGLQAGTAIAGAVMEVSGKLVLADGTVADVVSLLTLATGTVLEEILPADPGFKYRVLAATFSSDIAAGIEFFSGGVRCAAGLALPIDGSFVWPYNPHGWCDGTADQNLAINVDGTPAQVGVNVTYVKVPA